MKMNAKNIGLLAVSAIILAVPLRGNTAVTGGFANVVIDVDATSQINYSFTGLNTNTDSSAFGILGDEGSINSYFRNVIGSGVTNTYFTVASGITQFSGSANVTSGNGHAIGSVTLIDTYNNTTFALAADSGAQYNFANLVANHVYDWKVGFASTTGNAQKFAMNTGINVAAVPEPQTWAMLFAGTILLGMQLRRKERYQDSLIFFA